jgi:NAD(P)-dependent dehydrogenase (short-subunit alcohol dehydrogenase family)
MARNPGVALVTGGSTGTGRAVALGLGRAGFSIALLARTPQTLAETRALLEAEGVPGVVCVADVRDPAAVADAVASTEDQLGPILTVVNGAGTSLAIGPLWEVDPRAWWSDIETSLGGAFNVCRNVIPRMIAHQRGRILNVSSYAGLHAVPYQSAYGVAKSALANLTESLAASLAPHGIHAFTVTPGFVWTPLTRRVTESSEGRRWLPDLQHRSALNPDLFVQLVVTVALGKADELNGRFLHALDDLDELIRRRDEIVSDELYVPRLRRLPNSISSQTRPSPGHASVPLEPGDGF